jgi:hypothetical protein
MIGPGEINARSLLNLTEYFNNWRYIKNEEIDWELGFTFKLNTKLNSEELEHASVISTNINELVKVTCTLPSPVSILMNDQVVQLYFKIFCFTAKLRLHSRILNNLWKYIHIDL